MKTIISLIFLFTASSMYSQSSITFDSGTNIDIGVGADVCATTITINGTHTGTGTICNGPNPITMLSFNSAVDKNKIELIWITGMEINDMGFDVERKILKDGTLWQKIVFIQGSGTTNHEVSYAYVDKNLQIGKYQYRLKQIDYNGNIEYYYLVNTVEISKPKDFKVSQNYPNPSNPKSKIDFEIPINGKVTLKIFDLIGREVITIVNENKEAGYYSAEFDGTNLSSGVYFYRVIADGEGQKFINTKKIVLVK